MFHVLFPPSLPIKASFLLKWIGLFVQRRCQNFEVSDFFQGATKENQPLEFVFVFFFESKCFTIMMAVQANNKLLVHIILPIYEFIFCMQLVTVGLLKGKNLLIVVDEHNHHFGDFSSMIAMTIQQTETTLLPFGY